MNNKTIILPSARAIRDKQFHLKEKTLFLPNYITMSDFISKLTIVKNFTIVDNDTRILLLLEASKFQSFSKSICKNLSGDCRRSGPYLYGKRYI